MKKKFMLMAMMLALFAIVGFSVKSTQASGQFFCEEEIGRCYAFTSGSSSYTFNWQGYDIGGNMTNSQVVTNSIGANNFPYCYFFNTTRFVTVTVTGANGEVLLADSQYVRRCPDSPPFEW